METITIKDYGTTAVMRWVNEHPDKELNFTFFKQEGTNRAMVASDRKEEDIWALLDQHPYETWWHGQNDLEGWDRIQPNAMAAWYCRKGDRIIFITA